MENLATYEVKLPVFEGPLDLLLHLIEREELDITTISLAQVTDQYLEYISRLEERSAASLADFLVVASKLLLIKSRLLLPAPPAILEEEEEDVGEDLVRQLIEYKKFKGVAARLAEREKAGQRAYVRLGTGALPGKTLDIEDLSLNALLQAVKQALEIVPQGAPVSTMIPPVSVSIIERINLIKSTLTQRTEVDFTGLIIAARSRVEIIVTFLAVLELIKVAYLSVEQEKLFGRIVLRRRTERPKPTEETVQPGMSPEP
jgi:segregation and condensation protein A